MKAQLLTFLSIIILATACSKNESDSANENSLGNDSLVTRLKLKPTDKRALKISSQLFKDSKGSYLVSGLKNNKYWLGYFDKNGIELSTKTFDDPTEMKGAYGAPQLLDVIVYYFTTEAGGQIFMNRFLREGLTIYSPFTESLTRINMSSGVITNEYTEIYLQGEDYFTSFVGPWFNNTILISKISETRGGFSDAKSNIYSENNTLLSSFKGSYLNKYSRYITLSMTEYLDLTDLRMVTKREISKNQNYIFRTDLFPSLAFDDLIAIKKQYIEGNILITQADILKYKGDKLSVTSKMDIKTGKLLQ